MPVGQVKSFSAQKGYGFITDDNDSYFFHVSDLPKNMSANRVKRGMTFNFDDVPSPKGMQAKKLVKVEKITAFHPCNGHIVRRERTPRYGDVHFRVPVDSPFYRDPQQCRDALIEGAKRIGCNAVLGLKVDRNTWSRGNYKYTMHSASADLCLVVESRPCDKHEQQALTMQLENQATQLKSAAEQLAKEYQSKRFWQKFPWGLVVFAAVAALFFAIYL